MAAGEGDLGLGDWPLAASKLSRRKEKRREIFIGSNYKGIQ